MKRSMKFIAAFLLLPCVATAQVTDSIQQYGRGISFNMKEQYRNASIFVMTSLYEGFGMALLEALTCGLPCIAFDCPCGPREMISNDKNGFLIAESNVEEFADKLIYLMSHSKERKEMGRQAYLSSENFSTEKVMKQWMDLFDEVYTNG